LPCNKASRTLIFEKVVESVPINNIRVLITAGPSTKLFAQSSNLSVQNGFSVCTGTLYSVLIARTQGPGAASKFQEKTLSSQHEDRAGNCSCSCGEGCGEGCGERAVSSRRARRARDTVVGRPAPHARWSPVGHRPGPLGSQGQRKRRAHTHAFVLSVHLLLIAHCMCAPQCFPR
jgi:hypothetical protein